MNVDAFQLLQVIGPAVAVYVAIRVDMAAMKVRLDHLERDIYTPTPLNHQEPHHGRKA